jgi:putative membrane protein
MRRTWLKGTLLASIGLLLTFSGPAFPQSSDSSSASKMSRKSAGKPSAADLRFAREAAIGGMTEVELGKVVSSKAINDKVKQFAQRMVDDHSKANDQLKSIAEKEKLTIPSELDAKHKAMVDKYTNMSAGAGFDRAYMRDMVKDHETDVALFQKEATSGTDAGLKEFAAMTLPTLQDHLKMAKDTESSLGSASQKSK